jgi:hypothetical protein
MKRAEWQGRLARDSRARCACHFIKAELFSRRNHYETTRRDWNAGAGAVVVQSHGRTKRE